MNPNPHPVRIGVIGCGVIGPTHLKLAANCPAAKVVAVADLIPERAQSKAQAFGIPAVYFNDEDLLNDPQVEAVVLAMPTGDRTPVAYKALKRGKHVLLEKPVAARASEVRKMMALRKDRVVACCSSRMAFTAQARAAADCVASGVLGKIRVVRARVVMAAGAKPVFDPPPAWRQSMKLNGGGILVNWSCYDLNYLMRITGWRLRPRTVLARWWPVAPPMASFVAPGSDADAHFTAMILCDDDIVLSLERAEMSAVSSDQAWEIIGTEGSLHMPMLAPQGQPHTVVLDRFVPGKGVQSETIWSAETSGPASGDVISDFVGAIRDGREPETSLERALVMQQITDAIYASAAKGRSVAIR
jgi:predicted dehydrogenase